MSQLQYDILELKEEDNGDIWARIKLADKQPEDLALTSAIQGLERIAAPFGLAKGEALNWLLTVPGIDDFFGKIAERKRNMN